MTENAHRIVGPDELQEDGERAIKDIDGLEVAVIRDEGNYYAMANYCVHQGGPLCEGSLKQDITVGEDGWEWEYASEEKCISCPWHSWRFDLRTGRSLHHPDYAVPTYTVEEREDGIYVVF